jgi:hypothetical protein
MAPVEFKIPPGTYDVVLHFIPSDDKEITCLICNQNNCDLETTVRDWRHSRITIGKHSKCVWTPIKEICNGNP